MEEATPPTPSQGPASPPDELPLEFRPEVKIAAAVLLVLAWACVCFVFYRLGRQVGYESGVSSEMVAKQVNDEAVRNIAYFLQVASADDPTLLDTVLQHEDRLAWVKDPVVRREALGMLLGVVMERGLLSRAEAVLDEVMPPKTTESAAWISRMQKAARCLALAGKWEKAQAYFRSVEESFLAAGAASAWQGAMLERGLMLSAGGCGGAAEARLAGVQELLARQKEHAEDAAELHAELVTLQGRMLLEQGNHAAAEKCFREALAALQHSSELSSAALACCGAAHLELHERDAAEKYLKAALERGETDPTQRLAQIMALRDLATLSLNDNQVRVALDLIARAREMAASCLPADSLFWPMLAEQRGWALYMGREYEASLAEFQGVLQAVGVEEKLRSHPLEGIARNCLAMGRVEEALPAAQECVKIRESLFPEAQESLGRVLLLLGQAYDQAGQASAAAESYGRAASALPEGQGSRTMALVSQAQALMQAQQWEPAVQVWEAALSLLPADDAAFRERAVAQLADCRKKATGSAPEPPKPAPAKPRKKKTSRRSR